MLSTKEHHERAVKSMQDASDLFKRFKSALEEASTYPCLEMHQMNSALRSASTIEYLLPGATLNLERSSPRDVYEAELATLRVKVDLAYDRWSKTSVEAERARGEKKEALKTRAEEARGAWVALKNELEKLEQGFEEGL